MEEFHVLEEKLLVMPFLEDEYLENLLSHLELDKVIFMKEIS